MKKYDQLRVLYAPWRDEWIRKSRFFKDLPTVVAVGFRNFLECDDYFITDTIEDSKRTKYVNTCYVKFSEEDQSFSLSIIDGRHDPYFHSDGYCCFGVCVFLERAKNAYPKDPFWFLIRAKFLEQKLLLYFNDIDFIIDSENIESYNSLFDAMFKFLIKELEIDPITRSQNNIRTGIGFTAKF